MAAPRVTTSDPREYLMIVKNKLQDESDTYHRFLQVLIAFKDKRIGINEVISRVKELLKGHQELLLGFNSFLPNRYKITIEENQTTTRNVKYGEAFRFVVKVRATFNGDTEEYKLFLSILKWYRSGEKRFSEVYNEMSILFRDHPELFDEFCYFLPRG